MMSMPLRPPPVYGALPVPPSSGCSPAPPHIDPNPLLTPAGVPSNWPITVSVGAAL